MIREVDGNIFESEEQILVNEVSCDGLINNSLSYEFRLRNGYMYLDYKEFCDSKWLQVGRLFLYNKEDPNIICFPTKDTYKETSNVRNLEKGLRYLLNYYQELPSQSISFPMLGYNDGGILQEEFLDMMKDYFKDNQDLDVVIYRHHIPSRDKELVSFLDYVSGGGSLDGVSVLAHNRLANIIKDYYSIINSLTDILKLEHNIAICGGIYGNQHVLESDLVQAFASFREQNNKLSR